MRNGPRFERRTDLGEIPYETAVDIAREFTFERFLAQREKRTKAGKDGYTMAPTVLLVAGHLGAGKSTVTEGLEEWVQDLVVLDKDQFSDIFSTSRKDAVHKVTRDTAYDVMYQVAGEYLDQNLSVILDAPFNADDFFPNPEWVDRISALADKRGATVRVIWCDAESETKLARMHRRASTRERDRSHEEILALASRRDVPPIPFEHLVLNTERMDPYSIIEFLQIANVVPQDATSESVVEVQK